MKPLIDSRCKSSPVRHVAVVGAGYVGLVTAVVLSRWGYQVRCFDKDRSRIQMLSAGRCPIFEPGLPEALRAQLEGGRLEFSQCIDVTQAEMVFICVGTPPNQDGSAKLDDLYEVAAEIGPSLQAGALVVVKSTVPVGTCEKIEEILADALGHSQFHVLSNPEFLREGKAIVDAEQPDRIVIGARSSAAARALAKVFAPTGAPVHFCDLRTAELTKYAANAFLATKVSFINEIALLAEQVGADVTSVADAIGMDQRIGRQFLNAGIGYGGSCLPKDVAALRQMAESNSHRFRLIEAVMAVNLEQRERFHQKIENALGGVDGKIIGVLGLSFKANTSDVRESIAIDLVRRLESAGAQVRAYDPAAMAEARRTLKNGTFMASDAYDACADVDAIAVLTEWPEFAQLEWARIRELVREPNIFDGRNLLDPAKLIRLGFNYYGLGRNGHSEKVKLSPFDPQTAIVTPFLLAHRHSVQRV